MSFSESMSSSGFESTAWYRLTFVSYVTFHMDIKVFLYFYFIFSVPVVSTASQL